MTSTSDLGPIRRLPPRRYIAATLWVVAQIAVACAGMLIVYLTAMRMDGCVSSCRDDVANIAAAGLNVLLIVLLVAQILLFVVVLLRRSSPHIIGAVTIGLSLVAITTAYLLMVSAYPVPS